MTVSEMLALIDDADGFTLDIPASFGNPWTGIWFCPAKECCCRLVPRSLLIVLPESHHSGAPFHCPLCETVLVYDEEG